MTIRLLAALALFPLPAAAQAADSGAKAEACQELRGFTRGAATVRSAAWFAGGAYRAPNGQSLASLPAFCRAIVTASPAAGSNITIEVWLPAEDVWNGKLLATGNGGFAGSIRTDSLAAAVKRNYAGANTDMGTFPAALLPNSGYDAGIGHPELVKDWGYRATHEMTLAAKALIEKFYVRRLSRSYFIGCSTGGHQALSEAQRYPQDYDGLIAGAPGHNRTHLHAAFLQAFQAAQMSAPLFSPRKATFVTNAVLTACVEKDGGAPGDPYLNNPPACGFEPSRLLCGPNQGGDSCLTAAEVHALETFYDGTRNPRTHALIYPGWAKGTESTRVGSLQRAAAPTPTGTADGVFRWVFGPQWDARTFDFDRDMAKTDAQIGPTVNALSADLGPFTRHGGKLILFHGWADPVVSPYDSIIYFERINGVAQSSGAPTLLTHPSSFSRLFMAPGMSHCGGGLGADSFGQSAAPEGPPNPARDIVAALDAWVEQGVAPEQLTAAKNGPDGQARFERPLCAYPKAARYNGTGDPLSAASYTCAVLPTGDIEFPAPTYLK